MNTIVTVVEKDKPKEMTLGDLCGPNFDTNRSAFLGEVGWELFDLYLVTYQGISKATNPQQTWDTKNCSVQVSRFVDISISIVERKDDE